jgi:hypothetical protein
VPVIVSSLATIVKNPDVIDLTNTATLGSSPLNAFTYQLSLSAFNFLDQNNYNLWYTAVSGTNTVLVSNYIYRITATSVTASSQNLAGSLSAFTTPSDKLCYASTVITGNVIFHPFSSKPISVRASPCGSSGSGSSSSGYSTFVLTAPT